MFFWPYFFMEEFLKSLNDIGTLVIAIINVILIIYIFTYQREKDKNDRRLIIRQVNLNVKADWFKSLILEPNISFLHEFYKNMRALFEDYTGAQKSLDSSVIIRELNQNCNNIEFRFLTILGSVTTTNTQEG